MASDNQQPDSGRWQRRRRAGRKLHDKFEGAHEAVDLIEAANYAGDALRFEAAVSAAEVSYRGFFATQDLARSDQEARRFLTEAGRKLISALENLIANEVLWSRFALSEYQTGEMVMDLTDRIALEELLSHQIPELLAVLGYRPPPSSERWVEWVQGSLEAAMTKEGDFGRATAQAKMNLIAFRMRLARTIDDTEISIEENGSVENRSICRRLLAASIAALRAQVLPAAFGAAIAGALFAERANGLVSGVLAAFGMEGTKEFVKTTVEAASVTGLARQSPDSVPGDRFSPVLDNWHGLCYGLALLSAAAHPGRNLNSNKKDQAIFIARRSAFGIMQASDVFDSFGSKIVIRIAMDIVADIHGNSFNVAGVNRCVEKLDVVLRQLGVPLTSGLDGPTMGGPDGLTEPGPGGLTKPGPDGPAEEGPGGRTTRGRPGPPLF
ncbi:hypothetical protein FHR83_002708 [Actinoplanes campanulatus]|uniref:Uncharacterized protein n=1 Tax=Actinoplanes campanulatus TaxID=113559 RepID=A0A7W5AFE4_9ACTN|nr:hypothetical protein [Actinoplanes campanulatus]MBB3095045.1 hypothetical protein [Actinoplanes campanulatus]GGN23077.1 hypothetical protein GCM10010109_37890 [Actinoplanes campanulatus]GID34648.1 hypothetical protein Aca09nite_11540 [Actinoplanes campanulatus]